ncbi:hypothetical protein TSUD_56490, partial [Trifolium subterraneum]
SSMRASALKKNNNITALCFEDNKERIKNMFNKVELSISSYDTAFVAMVPSSASPHAPFFPQCLNWLLDNQLMDGSWGLPDRHPLLMNDALLSTLACILALKQWGIGEDKMNKVMKYQRKNGSLFNSPATTAAAFHNFKNANCLSYLQSVLQKFGNAVPTVYPLDIYARLYMIDSLERLGIDRHFKEEIQSVLDETYRYWLQGVEDIFLDPTTCAMAFRMLRLNGYDVCSDPFYQYSEDKFGNSLKGYLKDVGAVLELYKASQVIIHPDESVLVKQTTLFAPELSDSRLSGAKTSVLVTVVDDFFDVASSEEEQVNLIQLFEKWDVDVDTVCCSETVKIIFSALRSTICEIGEKSVKRQGRNVKDNVMKSWLDLLQSMFTETEWSRTKTIPTIDDYMQTACRESEQGKLNAVVLHMIHGNGVVTVEDAIDKIKGVIEENRRELLRIVLQEKGSVVPRDCKDWYWKMMKAMYLFYDKNDAYSLNEMYSTVNAVMKDPIILNELLVDSKQHPLSKTLVV